MSHNQIMALQDRPPRTDGSRPAAPAARVIAALALAVALSACAAVEAGPAPGEGPDIERVGSPRAQILSVRVRDQGGQLQVAGRVQKLRRGRSPVPGHLRIEALDRDGHLLAETTTSWRRLSTRTGLYEFAGLLPVPSADVGTVRVVHHVEGGS